MTNKNITKQIKKDILNNNCDYDNLCELLLSSPEEVIKGILNSYLYLLRNIDNQDNKLLLEDLTTLLNNYIKKYKNKNNLNIVYNKIEVFLSNLSKSFNLEELLKIEKYISLLVDIQNTCLINNQKRAKGDKYNFMLFLIFEKRDIELLERYIDINIKELLINKTIMPSVFITILEKYISLDEDNTIEIKYYNRLINIFLKGKIYEKLFTDNKEDYLKILKTSNKGFVWNLINILEDDLCQFKEDLEKDYNVSFIVPKYEQYTYLPNGNIDLTKERIFTIDEEGATCLDDGMSIRSNKDGTYTMFIHLANPASLIPYISNTMVEALKRSHTIYLIDENIPIFDRYLSDDILSLLPNKYTNALTIKVRVLPDYSLDLDSLTIIPSIVENKHKLTYQEVEEMITDKGILHDDLILLSKIFDRQAKDNPCIRAYHRMKEKINNQKNFSQEAPIAHMMVEQCNVFANSTIHIIDKRDKLDLIMPYKVQTDVTTDLIENYLEHKDFDIDNKALRILLRDYMMKSKYSYTNTGHKGLGIDGYVKISSASRRAMDALAIYVLYDLYINRTKDDLDAKYYYWEKEIKYWCEYTNNKISDNIAFREQYNYLYTKGKIKERRK